MSGDITGTPSGVPDLDDLDDFDVLRLLRGRLESIIASLDLCIDQGGPPHPVLLNAGTVGFAKHGFVHLLCEDWLGVALALVTIDIDSARERGLLDDGDGA